MKIKPLLCSLVVCLVTSFILIGCNDVDDKILVTNENIKKNFINKIKELKNNKNLNGTLLVDATKFSNWEKVCVVTPCASYADIEENFGFKYEPDVSNENIWAFFFIKDKYVVAELNIETTFLDFVDRNSFGKCTSKNDAIFIIGEDGRQGFTRKYFKFLIQGLGNK